MGKKKAIPKARPRMTKAKASTKPAETYTHPAAELRLRPDVGTQAQFRKKKPPAMPIRGRRFWRSLTARKRPFTSFLPIGRFGLTLGGEIPKRVERATGSGAEFDLRRFPLPTHQAVARVLKREQRAPTDFQGAAA